MRYEMISADCHLDLIWLPPDLFTANASAVMRDRMPYVADGPKGPVWVTKKGASLGHVNGMGSAGREYVPGRIHRADRMASTGLYEDGKKGIRRLSDPDLRLLDQDRDGVQAEVLYGGVLERYPRVRVVLGEAGIGWIPYILWRMDGEWEDQFKDFSLTMPPSEYRRRQCWATYQTDPVGLKLVDELGADRIMWVRISRTLTVSGPTHASTSPARWRTCPPRSGTRSSAATPRTSSPASASPRCSGTPS